MVSRRNTLEELSASSGVPPDPVPISPSRRFLGRLLDSLPWLALVGLSPFWSPPIPSLPADAVGLAYFIYHLVSYRVWSGHAGHLLVGARVRSMRGDGQISLGQAALRSLYDLAPLPIANLTSVLVVLSLMAAGARADFIFSMTIDFLKLDPSFGAFMATLSLVVWIANWFALGCIALPMGIMVLKRQDRRHAFDLLARGMVVRK